MHTKEAKKIAGLIVRESNKLEACHPKHYKRKARILRRGIMLSAKLDKVIGAMRPLSHQKEVDLIGYQMVEWMEMRTKDRMGRIIINPVDRFIRRKLIRSAVL